MKIKQFTLKITTIAATLLVLMPALSASAAPVVDWYTVNSTNTHVGNGAIIQNTVQGYYIGRAHTGDQLLFIDSKEGEYYGLVRTKSSGKVIYKCGRISHKELDSAGSHEIDQYAANDAAKQAISDAYSYCQVQESRIVDRDSIGTGFNCKAHVCVDGTFNTPMKATQCTHKFYYNIYDISGGKRAYDSPGAENGPVHYRFTTTDGSWAVVRSDTYGWGYVQKRCIDGHPLGGTKACTPALIAAKEYCRNQ